MNRPGLRSMNYCEIKDFGERVAAFFTSKFHSHWTTGVAGSHCLTADWEYSGSELTNVIPRSTIVPPEPLPIEYPHEVKGGTRS